MANYIQEKTKEFTEKHGLSQEHHICFLHVRLLDLTSEVGELCKEFNKITKYGKRPFSSNKNFEMEVGDILFSLACIANTVGFSLEKRI